ncbi:endolytic transglycosylase MltG [Clostridium sp. SHJSY1]|uniref:endolytic transglycosylase MltG n=1 Tax=Clostridium sp. SHJSY1 TaxID=2942483 RepID=UPI0028762527|nr:endolytic transglycosylase MltG [Clostridium sp. SHJSY1]MDS0524980.1 endolytic transglycosylase MltG [Clostridium sp. SHJSY1]
MKKSSIKGKLFKFIIVVIAIVLGLTYYYKSIISQPLKMNSNTIEIEVDEGESFNSVLEKLDKAGNLRNKYIVKLNLKLTNESVNLFSGKYEVSKNITLEELVKTLQTKDLSKDKVAVSIPEGYSIDNIAKRLEENGLFSKDEFINAVKAYKAPNFVKVDSRKKYNLEGYLYPDTYFFLKGVTPNEVINTMVTNFQEKIKEIATESQKQINDADMETLITKASLVEKETVLDDERPLVASVIENRLKTGMKLEFCSTVNYVIGYEGKELLKESDTKVNSPYNTYQNKGLPIGPITNPGKKSIVAALNPAKTDYLFFVLLKGQDGKQHFSKTLAEHQSVSKQQGYK